MKFFMTLIPEGGMAEDGTSGRNATRVRLHGYIIKIPVHLPNILRCGEKNC